MIRKKFISPFLNTSLFKGDNFIIISSLLFTSALFETLSPNFDVRILGLLMITRLGVARYMPQIKDTHTQFLYYFALNFMVVGLDASFLYLALGKGSLITAIISSFFLSVSMILIRASKLQRAAEKVLSSQGNRTLIYGASLNGQSILKKFLNHQEIGMVPVGFIDDDTSKKNTYLGSVPVLGNYLALEQIIHLTNAKELVVAIDNLSGDKLKHVVHVCAKNGIRPRLLAKQEGEAHFKYELFRDVQLEDLLSRKPIEVDLVPVKQQIQGKTVMVTGGGGSIGSELCRQLLKLGPAKIVIVDHSELNLYSIDNELHELKSKVELVSILADVKDLNALKNVFEIHRPEVIYHAAAYKHVHLVESNPYTSIINNIVGTRNLIECSILYNTNTFVLVSSDKAVNPSSIMGSTKRVCELLVTDAAVRTGKRFCSVRFGNVLGSSGSLIPLLKKQVRNGGPVTITDPKMTRYFMLIPEAVILVLKAGQISSPGDVNILRMGEPVRIIDIARKVIALMGKSEADVPITYIGIRPGEKLFEELYLCGNETATEHEDIMVLPNGDSQYDPNQFAGDNLEAVVSTLVLLSVNHDKRALEYLKRLVFMHRRESENLEAAV